MNRLNSHVSSRRSFLKGSAATAVAASFAAPLSALAADDTAEVAGALDAAYGGLSMGIQSYTLRSLSFEKALETTAKVLNLKEVEIFPGHHPGVSPPQVRQKVESYGLKVSAY